MLEVFNSFTIVRHNDDRNTWSELYLMPARFQRMENPPQTVVLTDGRWLRVTARLSRNSEDLWVARPAGRFERIWWKPWRWKSNEWVRSWKEPTAA